MKTNDRRCNFVASSDIEEALRIQRAFTHIAACIFLNSRGLNPKITSAVLHSRYDRRVVIRRHKPRPSASNTSEFPL